MEIKKKLAQQVHLKAFERRTHAFSSSDAGCQRLHNVAQAFVALKLQYPDRSILDSIPSHLFYPEIEDRIDMDGYISFFWDSEDSIYDSLMEYVNTSFQEYGVQEEPVAIQWFDQPQTRPDHNLDFEKQFFHLLNQLCDVLNTIA